MQLIIASNNKHKINEIKVILQPYFSNIMSLEDAGIDIDVVEDATTFEGNAVKKATEVFAIVDSFAILADDSGLCVDALGGAPGIYSARYAGQDHDDKANLKKLQIAMQHVPDGQRTAKFISAVALCRPNKNILTCIGECHGIIAHEPLGKNGFGYDPLFFLPEYGLSFAQLSSIEKNKISHRYQSLTNLRNLLKWEKDIQHEN